MRIPPHDLEAEHAALGAALLSTDARAVVLEQLTEDDFYSPTGATIYRAISELHTADSPVDALTVAAHIDRTGLTNQLKYEGQTGRAALLAIQAATPLSANVTGYTSIVAETARARRTIAIAGRLADASYARADTVPIVTELVDPTAPTSSIPLVVRWAIDTVANPPEEPTELIAGFLRRGSLTVIGAPRAIGKSWAAANLAVLCAQGSGYLFGHLQVVERARVLIAQGELDEWESSQRWKMLTAENGTPTGVGETFDRWRLRIVRHRERVHGDEREWFDAVLDPRLEHAIVAHNFDVLVIDPWAVYFAGTENSNDETEAALDKLRALAMRHNLAVVILHHLSKSRDVAEPEDSWRGASRLADWASTRVTILPHYTARQAEEQNLSRRTARRFVDVYFLRRGTPIDDISMELDPTTGWWSRWDAPTRADRVELPTDEVLAAIADCGGTWDSTRSAADALGVSNEVARRALAALARDGHLVSFKGERNALGWKLPQSGHQETLDP